MLPQDSLGLIQPVIWHEWKRWTEFCSPHKWVKYLHSWVYRDKVLLTALLTGGLFLVVKLNCFFTSRLHCANLRVMLVMSSVLMTLRLHSSLFLGLSLRCPTIIFFLWWEEIWGLLALRSYLYYTKIFSFPCLNLGSTPVDIGWFSVACPLCFGFFLISKFCSEKKPRLKKILPSSQLLRGIEVPASATRSKIKFRLPGLGFWRKHNLQSSLNLMEDLVLNLSGTVLKYSLPHVTTGDILRGFFFFFPVSLQQACLHSVLRDHLQSKEIETFMKSMSQTWHLRASSLQYLSACLGWSNHTGEKKGIIMWELRR